MKPILTILLSACITLAAHAQRIDTWPAKTGSQINATTDTVLIRKADATGQQASQIPFSQIANVPGFFSNLPAGSFTLSKLAQSGATTGQVVAWNGTAWAAATASGGNLTSGPVTSSGGVSAIADAAAFRTAIGATETGASIFTMPAPGNDYVMAWDGSGVLTPVSKASLVADVSATSLTTPTDSIPGDGTGSLSAGLHGWDTLGWHDSTGTNYGQYGHADSGSTNSGQYGHADSSGANYGSGGHADSSGNNSGNGGHADSNGNNSGDCGHADSAATNSGQYGHADSNATNNATNGHADSVGQNYGNGGHADSSGANYGSGGHADSLGSNSADYGHADSVGTNSGERGHADSAGTNYGYFGHADSVGTNYGSGGHADSGATARLSFSHAHAGYNTNAGRQIATLGGYTADATPLALTLQNGSFYELPSSCIAHLDIVLLARKADGSDFARIHRAVTLTVDDSGAVTLAATNAIEPLVGNVAYTLAITTAANIITLTVTGTAATAIRWSATVSETINGL